MSAAPRSASIPAQLLAAAARVVAEEGAEALTMERLARDTALSRATLYRRTGGRERLLDALAAAGADVGDRTEARARVLAAARVVFGRAGFDAATIEDIAAEAGVGAATVYRHFGDKEGLAGAFLDELGPRRAAREALAQATGDLQRDLERVAERLLCSLRDDHALARLVLMETLRGGPLLPRVRALSPARTLPAIAALLSSHMAAGRLREGDPRVLAQAFGGMVMAFGLLGPLFGRQPAPDPAATARAITELFLRGAQKEGPR